MTGVLVTGASGFIGRHCLRPLVTKGYEVHAVTSRETRDCDAQVRWHQADLLDHRATRELLESVRPSKLLHFAWHAVPASYAYSLDNLRWAQAGLELLRSFRDNGGSRLVAAGSCAEYDWAYGYCSERRTPIGPGTLYGVCKDALQRVLAAYARETALSSAWGRIFWVYGPHEAPSRLVPSIISALLARQPALCSEGTQIRDYLYVQDVADAFVALLESPVCGAVNVASGAPISVADLAGAIAEHLGGQDLLRLGGLPAGDGQAPLVVADVSRLRSEVGWRPQRSVQDGLEETIRWWQDHRMEPETVTGR